MLAPARIVAIAIAALFADALNAQWRPAPVGPAVPPPPPQALPVMPAVAHPAYAAQPLMRPGQPPASTTMPAKPSEPEAGAAPAPAAVDPALALAQQFRDLRVAGKDLKTAVERVVKELSWHDDLLDARAAAAASGKPVLWLQSLGDIDGFA